MHILIKNKKLFYNDYKVKCALGKRGIGKKRKEGDLITPKGSYKVLKIFYRKDRLKNLKTILKKIAIKKNMGWCNDSKSKSYNKLIRFPSNYSAEKLYRKDNIYDIILVLNFNMQPIKKNRGSAIFLHIAKKNFKFTEGCIAVKKTDLIKITQSLRRSSLVKII